MSDDEQSDISKFAPIRMEMDGFGHIFFVEYLNGFCYIKEINPWDDKNPIDVYELKTKECLGMSISNNQIYFLGENHIVIMLERLKD